MITFQTSVHIERPIDEVFAFVSDPLMFPRWNSAVQTVHGTSGETGGPGRRTRCNDNYRPARSTTNSRFSAATTPRNSASAQPRDQRPFSTTTDSPPTAPTRSHTSTPASSCPARQPFSGRSRRAESTRRRREPRCFPKRATDERARRLIPTTQTPDGAIRRVLQPSAHQPAPHACEGGGPARIATAHAPPCVCTDALIEPSRGET